MTASSASAGMGRRVAEKRLLFGITSGVKAGGPLLERGRGGVDDDDADDDDDEGDDEGGAEGVGPMFNWGLFVVTLATYIKIKKLIFIFFYLFISFLFFIFLSLSFYLFYFIFFIIETKDF